MQSLSVLQLKHAHLLEEHGTDCAALCRCKVELADAQMCEVDAHMTANTLLQAMCAAKDHATRAECTAALSKWEVGFLQALNICLCTSLSLYVFYLSCLWQIVELCKWRSLAGLRSRWSGLKHEVQLLQVSLRPDERIQELEERISYMDELMHSKTQEIEENDDHFIK